MSRSSENIEVVDLWTRNFFIHGSYFYSSQLCVFSVSADPWWQIGLEMWLTSGTDWVRCFHSRLFPICIKVFDSPFCKNFLMPKSKCDGYVFITSSKDNQTMTWIDVLCFVESQYGKNEKELVKLKRVKIAASTSSSVINGCPTVILTFNFKPWLHTITLN